MEMGYGIRLVAINEVTKKGYGIRHISIHCTELTVSVHSPNPASELLTISSLPLY